MSFFNNIFSNIFNKKSKTNVYSTIELVNELDKELGKKKKLEFTNAKKWLK